jgi:nitrous oxide reductase accessory protein NosL
MNDDVPFVVATMSGEIVRHGRCPRAMVAVQAGPGEQAVEGAGQPLDHYVWDGAVRPFTAAQAQGRRNRPDAHAVRDMGAMAWQAVRPAGEVLAIAKAEAWHKIKQQREASIGAVLESPFGRFDADPASRAALAEALALRHAAPGGDPVLTWTTADNQAVALTLADLADIGRRLAQRTQRCHDQSRQLRARIDKAETLAELASVAWSPPTE